MNSVMLERGDVLEAVRRVLERAHAGHGRALFIVGEAGLGKTAVLEAAIDHARGQFRIGIGRGDAVETALPFGLIGQALEHLLGAALLADDLLVPSGAAASDVSAATRYYATLRRLREAATAPLLLALDDVHWSDPDSLAFLHILCRRIATLPLAVLATTRPWPGEALRSAEELAAQGLADVEWLAPLSRPAARALLETRVGAEVPGDVLEHAVALSAGNPLLLEQIAGDVRRSGGLLEAHGSADGEAGQRFLLSRFVGQGEAGQRYVQAASVLGMRFRLAVAAQIAGLSGGEAAAALDALFRTGLLRDAGEGWAEFAHALIRQAVYENLSSPARMYLHEAAFRALMARGASAAEAVEHAIAAHLVRDSEAVATLAEAGREALRVGAVRAARRHLEAGVDLADDGAPANLLLDLGAALMADGAVEAAVSVHERLLRHPSLSEPARIAALRQLGRAAFNTGDLVGAGRWFEAAVRLTSDDHPELALAALLDQSFLTWAHLGPRAAQPVTERARELAHNIEGPLHSSADAAWALCAHLCGDPRGIEVAEAAAQNAAAAQTSLLGDAHWMLDPACVPADVAVWSERFALAEQLFTALLSTADQRAEPFIIFHASFSWADGLCRLGRLEESLAVAERAVEVAELVPITLPLALIGKALTVLEMGRLQEAAALARQAADTGADGHPWYLVVGFHERLRGTLALRRGEVDTACSIFARLDDLANSWGLRDPCQIPWAADAISAHLLAGRDTDASRAIDRLEACASLRSLWPQVVAAVGRASLAERAGDIVLAESTFGWALVLQEEIALPLARARTLIEYGAFLCRQDHLARARPILAEALRVAEACGAGWCANQARVLWRRAGGRAGRRGGVLTPQEAAVAQLVRQGKTNREIAQQLFLSVNTVETHLRHVYGKLGIHRRWELIARDDLTSTDEAPPDVAR